MMEFFAANRRGHPTNQEWRLLMENPFPEFSHGALNSHRGDFTPTDILAHIHTLYPNGLSPHGWYYYMERYGSPLLRDGGSGLPNEPMIEIVFENVRKSHFQDRPSRLQSYFAYDTAERVRSDFPDVPIVRFHSTLFFLADQTWLNVSHQLAVAEFNAHRYWSGSASATPSWEYLVEPPFHVEPIN